MATEGSCDGQYVLDVYFYCMCIQVVELSCASVTAFFCVTLQSEEIKVLLKAVQPSCRASAPTDAPGLCRPTDNEVMEFLTTNQWAAFLMAKL